MTRAACVRHHERHRPSLASDPPIGPGEAVHPAVRPTARPAGDGSGSGMLPAGTVSDCPTVVAASLKPVRSLPSSVTETNPASCVVC